MKEEKRYKDQKAKDDNKISIQEKSKKLSISDILALCGGILGIVVSSMVSVVGIIALLALVIIVFQKVISDCYNCLSDFLDLTTKASNSINTIHINSPNIISENVSASRNDCINVVQDTVEEHIKQREISGPFQVSSFIRNLPPNQHASNGKLAYCAANGIILGENQTFVNGYTKGLKT